MPRLIPDDGASEASGTFELAFENFGDNAASNILIIPSRDTLPSNPAFPNGELLYIVSSGVLYFSQDNSWVRIDST